MVRVLSNSELDALAEEQGNPTVAAEQELAKGNESVLTDLAGHVRKCWVRSYQAKAPIQQKLLDNLRNFNSTYSPSKLAEIRQLEGSEVFIPMTSIKCNAATSHLNDIFFNSTGDQPFDLDSTPVPELPLSTEEQIKQDVLTEVMQIIAQYAALTGQDPIQMANRYKPEIVDRVFKKMREASAHAIDDLKRTIADQLTEGSWHEELKKVIFDLVVYDFGCLKGPIYKKEKYFKRVLDPMTGKYSNSIEEKVQPVFERRSPFNIYPAPASVSIDDDYIFDLLPMSLQDLYNCIGLPGFDEEAIRATIQDYKGGLLKEWVNFADAVVYEQTRGQSGSQYNITDFVDVLEFWGAVNGQDLLDWGMTPEDIPDPDAYYDVCVWLVGTRVLKAMLNPDPMGRKPFHIKSYVLNNDSVIGGKGLATLLEPFQQICNALARAIVNNSAISSGPIVEFNDDRLSPGYSTSIHPWKKIISTNQQMSEQPAVRFYQANPVTEQLIKVYDYFSKLADQYSIPGYAHGDIQVGGAGNTASGLQQLMNASDKVIKNVVKNVDEVIISSIELLYFYNMEFFGESMDYIGDVQIVARGSSALLRKEQEQMRRIEFLNMTNNPVDLQIMGLEGRKALLQDLASSLNLESLQKEFPIVDSIDELKQEVQVMIQQYQEQQMRMQEAQMNADAQAAALGQKQADSAEKKNQADRKYALDHLKATGKQPPKAKAPALDAAGSPQSGQDNRLVPQTAAPQQRANLQ